MAQDCIFCRIRDGVIEGDVLYRDDTCFVIKDIAPKASVHLLVIPNKHYTLVSGLTPQDYSMIGGMFEAAGEMARREGVGGSGYRLIINQGAHAGQMVDHLHLHVLGGNPLGPMG